MIADTVEIPALSYAACQHAGLAALEAIAAQQAAAADEGDGDG